MRFEKDCQAKRERENKMIRNESFNVFSEKIYKCVKK